MNPFGGNQAQAGLEFFQSLLKSAGMPAGFANWMAPTVDVGELERKTAELRAVQQWLEANARLTQAAIQALEVQRMTLMALQTMDVDLGDLASRMSEAVQAGAAAMAAAGAEGAEGAEGAKASPNLDPEPNPAAAGEAASAQAGSGAGPAGLVDPMQWWSAVSQQFAQTAAQALRDNPWPMPAAASAASTPQQDIPASAGAKARRASPGRGARQAAAPKGPPAGRAGKNRT